MHWGLTIFQGLTSKFTYSGKYNDNITLIRSKKKSQTYMGRHNEKVLQLTELHLVSKQFDLLTNT